MDSIWSLLKERLTAATFIIAVLATLVFVVWGYTEVMDKGQMQPRNEVVRNYGLLIIAFWGAVLAVWRSQVAEKQAKSAAKQAENTSRQVETSERGLRNERYQRGAEMLGSEIVSTRLGGLYALRRLALDQPEDYHIQVMEILSAVVRHSTPDKTTRGAECREDAAEICADVKEIIKAIKEERSDCLIDVEREQNYKIDLSGCFLEGGDLSDAKFSCVCIGRSSLVHASGRQTSPMQPSDMQIWLRPTAHLQYSTE